MKIDLEDFQETEREESFYHTPRRKRKKHKFLKFLFGFVLTLIIVGSIGYLTLKFIVGPVVKTVDGLPTNFPEEIAIYQLDKANISLQTKESRQKIISGIMSMPDWVLTLFLNILSDDLRSNLAENFGDELKVDNNFNIDNLKEAIKAVDLENVKTVNLSWEGLGKTKEEIAAYYKEKLSESNFEFKENLGDYEINLGFWKDGIFGIMSFIDSKKGRGDSGYNSDVDITVNYFDEMKNED